MKEKQIPFTIVTNIKRKEKSAFSKFYFHRILHVKSWADNKYLSNKDQWWLLRNLNYTKSNKKRTLYIDGKKKKKKKTTRKHKVLQFPSMNFLILKSLHDSLIINIAN